mgnify:CR=1 FL=1
MGIEPTTFALGKQRTTIVLQWHLTRALPHSLSAEQSYAIGREVVAHTNSTEGVSREVQSVP